MPSGRFRFAILAATVAAFLLVPVAGAQAAAGVETLKIDAKGQGSGKMVVGSEGAYKGVPPANCTYAGKGLGTATGTCELQLSDEGEGYEQAYVAAAPSPGSKFIEWTVENYEFEGCGAFAGCAPYVEPSGTGGDNGVAIALFCLEGQSKTECLETVKPKFPLTIAKTGEGTIASSPAGIECTGAKTGAECVGEFNEASTVTLTASPATGYAFSAWGGCLTHEGLKCTVLMDKAKTVKATFVATPSLTIEKAGTGFGKVAATGISCDESCSKESSAVKTGTSVTVKTTPAKGNEAAVIEGGTGSASACSGSTCTFTIEANSSLKVKYSPIPSKTLTVKLTGPGAYKGKVSGKGTTVKGLVSTAILCGTGCTTETESFFATGTTELVASTVIGYKFAGWTVTGGTAGTCTGTTSPCTLQTDANKTVSAEFK